MSTKKHSRPRCYFASAWQQALPGVQHSAFGWQHDLSVRQQLFPTEQHPPDPFWQQSAPPVGQTVAPGGQHPQHPDGDDEAWERTPKPITPRAAAHSNVNTDRRFITKSPEAESDSDSAKWWWPENNSPGSDQKRSAHTIKVRGWRRRSMGDPRQGIAQQIHSIHIRGFKPEIQIREPAEKNLHVTTAATGALVAAIRVHWLLSLRRSLFAMAAGLRG